MTFDLTKPYFLAAAIFLLSLVFMSGSLAIGKMDWMATDELTPWMFSASFLLLFSIACSLFSLRSEKFSTYWSQAIYSFLGLGAANAFTAQLISGISIGEAGSYKGIYIVVAIGFLVFLSMLNFIKKIVQFAEREEWNSPRMKNRK